jgi:bacillithiol system protein YtxJ
MQPLTSLGELDTALARSVARPIVIFKHSHTCGTSAQAYDEIEDVLGRGLGAETFLVDVRAHRSLSQAIAARFNVRHESPQVLLIQNGAVRWHTSHFRVTADAIAAAVLQAGAVALPPAEEREPG